MLQSERNESGSRATGGRKVHLRLVVALPFVTGLLSFGIGVYAYQAGRDDAASLLTAADAARVWATPPTSIWWLLAMTLLGALIGLSIALAFTRQLKQLARRTEFLALRNFSVPVELVADGEVAPLVDAINDLLRSVREYARQSVADGVLSFNRAGKILALNPRAAVALGVEAENVIGAGFQELIPAVAANQEISEALVRAFEFGEPFDLEDLVWVNTRGQQLRVDLKGTLLAGEESIVSVLVVFDRCDDIESVQKQVSRAHRLLVIGGFASELAHEIRNPLSSVIGLVDLLHERLPDDDEGHRHLEVLSRAAGRIERLVGQLLDLVPTEMHDLERRDAAALVRETVAFVRYGELDRHDVEVVEHYEENGASCLVDADRVGRALENLLRNAFSHTPANGRITVTTGKGVTGDIEIEIANTGSYIPPAEHERIFQPFVSCRANGTGLGLAISQQIAYGHGGSLRVESVEGSHTSFTFCLPSAEEMVPIPAREPAGPALLAGAM